METVQLQCGSCQKRMAISVAHLGGQVQCPHCRAVVQTPPRSPAVAAPAPAPMPAPTPPAPPPQVAERESIFAGPEVSEDLFGDSPSGPQIEMPAEAPAPTSTAAVEFVAVHEDGAAAAHEHEHEEPAPEPSHDFEDDGDDDATLPAHQPRPVYDKGMAPLIALIFLVPYAILSTAFIAYLLIQLRNQPHPLDMLPDPKEKGAPHKVERIKHDYGLAAHQKVPLGQALRVGDLEVVPERVEMKDGNLVLTLKARNRSADYAFAPLHDSFLHVQNDRIGGKPYTFLQSDNHKPLYGGFVQVLRNHHEVNESEWELNPGQEETIVLTTMDADRATAGKIAASNDHLLWRVQLRRGPISYRGRQVSATTVIGVQFSPRDVVKA